MQFQCMYDYRLSIITETQSENIKKAPWLYCLGAFLLIVGTKKLRRKLNPFAKTSEHNYYDIIQKI
jgi:hypothetical protein